MHISGVDCIYISKKTDQDIVTAEVVYSLCAFPMTLNDRHRLQAFLSKIFHTRFAAVDKAFRCLIVLF